MTIEELPDLPTFTANIIFCLICEDLMFHFLHRFLHWRPIYPYIHKLHHDYTTTVSIASEYANPLEYYITGFIPSTMAAILLKKRMHFYTAMIWMFARSWETTDGHSGYEFPWSPFRLLPFSTSATYHDFHHSHNVGNYSSMFTFWDTVFGLNVEYYSYWQKLKDSMKRKQTQ